MGCAHSAPAVAEPLPSAANSGLRKVQDAPTPADPDSPEALARDTYCERCRGLRALSCVGMQLQSATAHREVSWLRDKGSPSGAGHAAGAAFA